MYVNNFFDPINLSPFALEIMQEDKDIDQIIRIAKIYLLEGEDVVTALELALLQSDISFEDLSKEDQKFIWNTLYEIGE